MPDDAKTIRRDWLDQMKRELTADRIVPALGLTMRGKRVFCPACQSSGGRTPDLSVSDAGFHCFKCGVGGDLVALVQLVQGCDFPAALDWLARETGHPRPGQTTPRRTSTPSTPRRSRRTAPPVATPMSPDRPVILQAFLDGCRPVEAAALAYLTDRGIDAAVVRQLGVKFCGREYADLMRQLDATFGADRLADAGLLTKKKTGPGWYPTFWPFIAKQIGVLVLPYWLDGQPVYLKVRPPLSKAETEAQHVPRFLNTGAAVPCPFNADVLTTDADRVFICEGETDTMTALTHGYPAVGIPGWSAFKAGWLDGFRGKTVYLVLDADAAGEQGVLDIARKFERGGLPLPKHVILPPGRDLNDFLRDGSTERRHDGQTA